jgi:hypothetical protein
MRYRRAPASDRCRDIAGPSQSSDRQDVLRKPIPVMRVSDDSKLASHVLGVTADHGGDFGGRFTSYHSSLVNWSFPMSGHCP